MPSTVPGRMVGSAYAFIDLYLLNSWQFLEIKSSVLGHREKIIQKKQTVLPRDWKGSKTKHVTFPLKTTSHSLPEFIGSPCQSICNFPFYSRHQGGCGQFYFSGEKTEAQERRNICLRVWCGMKQSSWTHLQRRWSSTLSAPSGMRCSPTPTYREQKLKGLLHLPWALCIPSLFLFSALCMTFATIELLQVYSAHNNPS